jgi:hypothetical protein
VYGNADGGINVFRGSGHTIRNNIMYDNGRAYGNYANLRGGNQQASDNLCNEIGEACTLAGNPRFHNVSGDFHLKNTSAAINAGMNPAGLVPADLITADHEGRPRPRRGSATPDVGAYECQNPAAEDCTDTGLPRKPGTLVAHYPFEAGSGITVVDAAGGHHPGRLNSAGWTTGLVGAFAGDFDGARVVTISTVTEMQPTAAFGVSLWIRTTATASDMALYNINDRIGLGISGNNAYAFFFNGSTSPDLTTSGVNLRDGAVHHLVYTYDGAAHQVYIDNVPRASAPTTGAVVHNGGAATIGQGLGGKYAYTGVIDDVKLFDGFLTPQAVSHLFNEGTPPTGLVVTERPPQAIDADDHSN